MKPLFASVKDGAAIKVSQDGDRVVVETIFDGVLHESRLPIPQAVVLAVGILAENIGHVGHVAEMLDDTTCAAIGQAFLIPVARRSLDRKAFDDMPPGVMN